MLERGDINAGIEMGLAQIMLELHSNSEVALEIRAILNQILERLASLEAKQEHST